MWLDAWSTAGHEGWLNRLPFLSEDLVFEERVSAYEVSGSEDVAAFAIDKTGSHDPSHPVGVFLSAEALLVQYFWVRPVNVDWLDRYEMRGPRVERWVDSASIETARFYDSKGFYASKRDPDAIEEIADRYVEVWNGTDRRGAGALYAEDARVEDTLLGESLRGVDEITAAIASEGWPVLPSAEITNLGDWPDTVWPRPSRPRGRAIYDAPALDPEHGDEVRVVLDVDDGSGCPGLMAVELGWDGERVVWEQRYHEPESVRRCFDPDVLQPGWWDGIEVPDPVRVEETEPMVWAERDVTVRIFNGNEDMTEFVRWGLERFDIAGLPLPAVASVTFLTHETRCTGLRGLFQGEGEIVLCYAPAEICSNADCSRWFPPPRHYLLHELAHVWLAEHVGEDQQQEYLAYEGVANWSDPNDPWGDRGVERAAETIAYGLSDQPTADRCTVRGPSETYPDGFRLLTGREPLVTCP